MLCWGDWSETGRDGSPGHMRYSRREVLACAACSGSTDITCVDEFLASKRCYGCKSGYCGTFRYVENPRKSTHKHRPLVLRWGLTWCNRHTRRRLWDRDVNSALNILWIAVLQLVHNQERHACLSRRHLLRGSGPSKLKLLEANQRFSSRQRLLNQKIMS